MIRMSSADYNRLIQRQPAAPARQHQSQPNTLKGYIRHHPSGAVSSAIVGEGRPPPWGLTEDQAARVRAGERIELPDGSVIAWRA